MYILFGSGRAQINVNDNGSRQLTHMTADGRITAQQNYCVHVPCIECVSVVRINEFNMWYDAKLLLLFIILFILIILSIR